MANLFADNFESGNLNAWSIAVTDGGNLSAATGAALHGSYGASYLVNDANWLCLTDETPNAEVRYRCRFYFDPNSITIDNGSDFNIFKGLSIPLADWVFQLGLKNNAGTYQIIIMERTWVLNVGFNITDSPHCIEVDWKAGVANGFLMLWIDGVLKVSNTTLAHNFQIDLIQIGALWPGTARGTFYLDDFASNNDGSLIGMLHKRNTATISKFNGAKVTKINGVL